MAPACREWAVVVHALLEGEQILVLRTDGLQPPMGATRCWLVPIAEHQDALLLKEPYRLWIQLARAAPLGESIRIEGWADVVKIAPITGGEELDAIASKVVWADDYAGAGLGWNARDPLWVLALRVHRLLEPRALDDLPDDPASLPSAPALSDIAFAARLQGCVDALPTFVDTA